MMQIDLTSSAVAEERQDISSTNTIDEIADAITGGNDIGLWALWPGEFCHLSPLVTPLNVPQILFVARTTTAK